MSTTLCGSVVKLILLLYEIPAEFIAYALTKYLLSKVSFGIVILYELNDWVFVEIILLLFIVGLSVIPQQIPLSVMFAPPLDWIVTSTLEEVSVISNTKGVVNVANVAVVINETSEPYPVPVVLIA